MQFKLSKILSLLPSFGFLTYSLFIICIISGIILAYGFDINNAYDSISQIILINPNLTFIRSIHYWSSQLFLIISFIHIIDHLLKKSEQKIKEGIWIRLILTIPLIFYAMFSGFLLRNDIDAQQAKNIAETLFSSIPLLGELINNLLFGNNGNLIVIYINHIATVTILIWLVTIEHSKKILPNSRYLVYSILPVIFLSYFFVPFLKLPDSSIIKGPWYFVAVQEFLHWFSEPIIFIVISFAILILFYLVLKYKKRRKLILSLLSIIGLSYLILTIVAYFFRGENWELHNPLSVKYSSKEFNVSQILSNISDTIKIENLQKINGNFESCVVCHQAKGFVQSHDLSITGCYSCHMGNPLSLDKDVSHQNMVLIPGNMSDAKKTCGRVQCHSNIVDRVHLSLMNTMSGVVAVDKWVFDETDDLSKMYNIQEISNTPADKHLKNLCASCHLSKEKTNFGAINETSRGGGCNACHLKYDKNASLSLKLYKKNKQHILDSNYYHPKLTINIDNTSCFGCHSRSGRISLSYEGWQETKLEELPDNSYKKLLDGRILQPKTPDVHHQKGMICIDCHISYEIMGDGKKYPHKENQIIINCEDCHSNEQKTTITYNRLDYETKRLIEIRGLNDTNRRFLKIKNSKYAYSNVFVENDTVKVILKNSNKTKSTKPPSSKCGINIQGHQDMTCESCHNSWSPQCIGCHTQYEPKTIGYDNLKDKEITGTWVESDGVYLAEPAVLGVDESNGRKIKSFIPGMILTIEGLGKKIFKRLYAPAFSHTIQKNTRNCKECHFNPLALGYGRGELKYDKTYKKIYFTPYYALNQNDMLPEDAWIPFLSDPKPETSTRKNNRPFTKKEQMKIMNIGVCFQCHTDNEQNFMEIFYKKIDWKSKISKSCILLYK